MYTSENCLPIGVALKEKGELTVDKSIHHVCRYHFRDLTSWINGIMALVTSDELAKDVASAEALLDRHQVRIALLDWRLLSLYHL